MKKIIIVLLGILILINVVVGGLLFLDIRVFKAPAIHVVVDPVRFSPDEILLEARISIQNPNSFEISIKNIRVASFSQNNLPLGEFFIPGGSVSPNANITFVAQDNLAFHGNDYSTIKNTISTTIGISLFGIITKTIPFEASVDVSLSNITDHIVIPVFQIQAEIDDIIREGIQYNGTIDVYNPNAFEVSVENLSLTLKTENNIPVGTTSLNNGVLEPGGSLQININGTLLFLALNAERIHANLTGTLILQVAGIRKSLPISVSLQFHVPDLSSLLSLNKSFNFILSGDFKLKLRGVLCSVEFTIYNPSEIPLEVRNLVCNILRLDQNETRLLASQNMTPCVIEPKNEVCVGTQILLPYTKLLFSGARRILPDWFILEINGNISISGVTQAIPITITGHLSPHFLINRA